MPPSSSVSMKIADLERSSGVPRSTIHHYLNLGLLPRPRVLGPKLHLFGDEHAARLRDIQALREKGWPLPKIRAQLARRKTRQLADDGTPDAGIQRRIVQHATTLFAERGYEGVRLSDVARDLGMGKATIYRHYASKQALFVDCVEQVRFTLVPKAVRDAGARDLGPAEQAEARTRAVLTNFRAYRTFTHLLGSLAQGGEPDLATKARKELHQMVTNVEPLLRASVKAGLVRKIDPELTAYMLWGALIAAGDRMVMDDRYDLDQVVRAYQEFVALGLLGRGSGVADREEP